MPETPPSDRSSSGELRSISNLKGVKLWILYELNRWIFATLLAACVFGILMGFSYISPSPMRQVFATSGSMEQLFASMIVAMITAVSLVVSFNQLVLSQELGALGDQRERMQAAVSFREDVTPSLTTAVSPPDPASFMATMLDSVQVLASDLETRIGPIDQEPRQQIETYVQDLTTSANDVTTKLEDAQFGTFDVISALLEFEYSINLFEAERLFTIHQEALDSEAVETLEELMTLLKFFGPAREHFKTLYFQWELVNLSRSMLYSSLPALTVAIGMLVYVDPSGITGTTLGVDHIVWLVCVAVTITLTPFLILISFVLRIATVAKRTLAIGAFVLRGNDQHSGKDLDQYRLD